MRSSLSPSPSNKNPDYENESDEDRLIGEAVVSVVTTKSVVNGTISVPSYLPSTTEQIISPIEPSILSSSESPLSSPEKSSSSSETTEDSIIVASVQTSRSISGARFLPFNLNGETPDPEKNKTDKNNKSTNLESTESIIDKLDRVQSELSGGFLAGGFRTGGNALQLDVLNEQRLTTSKSITTTGKTPVISKFIPRRYNDRKTIIATTTTTTTEAEVTSTTSRTADDNTIDNSYETTNNNTTNNSTNNINNKIGFRWPSLSRRPTTTVKSTIKRPIIQSKDTSQNIKLKNNDEKIDKSLISDIIAKSKINLSSLLPDNYKLKETTTVKSLTDSSKFSIQNLIGNSAVDISAFLPPDYNKKSKIISNNSVTVTTTTTTSTPIQKTLQELFSKSSSIDISSLLPAGYDKEEKNETIELEKSKILPMEFDTSIGSTTKSPGIKLVFPSRPGGRKAVQQKPTILQNRFTTTLKTIQKGWPTRFDISSFSFKLFSFKLMFFN